MSPRQAWTLAIRLLSHDRNRLLTSIGGVAFALLLMFMQLGFRNALLDSSLELLRALDADILVLAAEKEPFLARDDMPAERLYQSLSVPGVEAAYPVWLALLHWRNLEDGTQRPMRVIGFNPIDPVFLLPGVNAARDALRMPDTALVDERSRDEYGAVRIGPAEVAGRQIDVVGTFRLGADFEAGGSLIVGHETFFRLRGAWRTTEYVEMALVHARPDANLDAVVAALRAVLPPDVHAFTKDEIIARDLEYWKTRTPLSIVLLIGVSLGFAVGVVICYQILYTEVIDHLPEFATLKAMGYGDGFIRTVVFFEGGLLSVLGFLPSAALGALLLRGLGGMTGLPARFASGDLLVVLALSFGMCTLAGALALRQLAVCDPAELF